MNRRSFIKSLFAGAAAVVVVGVHAIKKAKEVDRLAGFRFRNDHLHSQEEIEQLLADVMEMKRLSAEATYFSDTNVFEIETGSGRLRLLGKVEDLDHTELLDSSECNHDHDARYWVAGAGPCPKCGKAS